MATFVLECSSTVYLSSKGLCSLLAWEGVGRGRMAYFWPSLPLGRQGKPRVTDGSARMDGLKCHNKLWLVSLLSTEFWPHPALTKSEA